MSQRVTDEQAKIFAAYVEDEADTVWYRAEPKLLEQAQSEDSRADEFAWLRDLALDLLDCRESLRLAEERSARLQAECEAWRSVDRLTAIFTPNETCDCLIEARRLRAANEQAG